LWGFWAEEKGSGGNSGGRETRYLNRSLGIDLDFEFLRAEIFPAIPI
jgi:hypothetical protein